jgi:ubiquinone/menaquinone biosynthesis C-methylase UbiE
MVMDPRIVDYYDRLAESYDEQRFGNSYGRMVDVAERAILARLAPPSDGIVLDLACGTGRLTSYASIGIDASLSSLQVAQRKHSDVTFIQADAARLPLAENSVDFALCFHLLMHLECAVIEGIFSEVGRVLKPGGSFVVDFPSAFRRALRPNHSDSWHGATALSVKQARALGRRHALSLVSTTGLLVLPIHRLPAVMLRHTVSLDSRIGRTWPAITSYIVAQFTKEVPSGWHSQVPASLRPALCKDSDRPRQAEPA